MIKKLRGVSTFLKAIMKVEAAYFYHKRAVDEKQGIYFAWPYQVCITKSMNCMPLEMRLLYAIIICNVRSGIELLYVLF